MGTKYHLVHYRLFQPKQGSDGAAAGAFTFEQKCRAAFNTSDAQSVTLWDRPEARIYKMADDQDQRSILVNKVADLTDAVFGEMCLVQDNGLQAMINSTPRVVATSNITNVQIFDLEDHRAPQGQKFIRGMAYWMVIKNHLFFVKTHNMTHGMIEAYLQWLLISRTKVLSAAQNFSIQAQFDNAHVGDLGDIRSLRIAGSTQPMRVNAVDNHNAPDKVKPTSRTVEDKSFVFEQAREIFQSVLGKDRTDSLVKSLGPEESLSVDASFKIRGRRTEKSRQQMKSIANDLANLTDANIQVEGKDFKMKNGDAILRMNMPFNLPHEDSNLLEFDNVADQIQKVYSRFVEDGKIQA